MTTFQVVILPLLGLIIVVTAAATARNRVAPRVGIAWIALWLSAAIAIAFPDLLVSLAAALGIGRGADLVLYVFILAASLAFFLIYLRFRRLDEQMTHIIRHIAIDDALRKDRNEGQSKGVPET